MSSRATSIRFGTSTANRFTKQKSVLQERELEDLVSVGPAIMRDFEMLGVRSVAQLTRLEPRELYGRLCEITGRRQDPCVFDVFRAAVEQARNPALPLAQCQWWYWSRERKRTESVLVNSRSKGSYPRKKRSTNIHA